MAKAKQPKGGVDARQAKFAEMVRDLNAIAHSALLALNRADGATARWYNKTVEMTEAGYTIEEITEGLSAAARKSNTWKGIKFTVTNAAKFSVKLRDENGDILAKGKAQEAINARNPEYRKRRGARTHEATPSEVARTHEATPSEVAEAKKAPLADLCDKVLTALASDAKLRRKFRDQIIAVARANANDMAEEATARETAHVNKAKLQRAKGQAPDVIVAPLNRRAA